MKNHIKILLIITLTIAFACNKKILKNTQNDFDYSYFPTDSGKWVKYEVINIKIDKAIGIADTLTYNLITKWGESFTDGENNVMHKLHRFIKQDNSPIKLLNTWYAGNIGDKTFQTEENIKFVKIKYPLKKHKNWDGNAYNHTDTLNNFLYKIIDFDVPETINNIAFDSVLTINQRDYSSEVEKYFYQEKYAKNIGLIEKQSVSIYSTDINPNIPIEKRITKGNIFIIRVKEFGTIN